MVSLPKIFTFLNRRKNFTLVDLSFFESYLKQVEIVCYYDPNVDDDSTKLRKRHYINLVIGLSTIQQILEANPPYTHQGEDIFKSGIVTKKEIENIRRMCLEFLRLDHQIKKSIETMLGSRHKKFKNKAADALEAFNKLQELMPILLQAANME